MLNPCFLFLGLDWSTNVNFSNVSSVNQSFTALGDGVTQEEIETVSSTALEGLK